VRINIPGYFKTVDLVAQVGWRRRFRWGRTGFATRARWSLFSAVSPVAPAPAGRLPKQLHALANDTQFGSFLPSLLVVPGVHLQAAFDETGRPFFKYSPRSQPGAPTAQHRRR